MTTPQIPGLLQPPRQTFGRFYVERWEQGRAANRRIRQLRKALPCVETKSIEPSQRWTADLGAKRVTVAAVEFTYCVPVGVVVPAPVVDEERAA